MDITLYFLEARLTICKLTPMERIHGMSLDYNFLCSIFTAIWYKCEWRCLVGFNARNKTLYNHILYLDIESAIYEKAKEMDAESHDTHIVFVDSVSSLNT